MKTGISNSGPSWLAVFRDPQVVTILPNDERDDEGFQRYGYRVFWRGQWHYPSSLAIDNATACRETRAWLDERNLIAEGWL